MSLAGRFALVTGSGPGKGGLGYAVVRALASSGANVGIHGFGGAPDALQERAREIQEKFGVQAAVSAADLRDPAAIRQMMREMHDRFGGVDILCNNAGIQKVAAVQEFPEDKWDDIIAICLTSAFHTTKAVLPHMLQQKWGRIINTGSMHSLVASPHKSAYNAAKHGIAGFTKTVALETARAGNITCNAICPGYMLTELVENQIESQAKLRGIPEAEVVDQILLADQPTKRFVNVDEVGSLVKHLCSDDARSITGACLSIDGGWTSR